MNFDFTTTSKDNFIQFNLSGDLIEKDQSSQLVEFIEDSLEQNNSTFILSLAKMNYLNSTGLGVFINLLTKIRNAGGELIICEIPAKINQLLLITKLNTVFTVCDSIAEAEQTLN